MSYSSRHQSSRRAYADTDDRNSPVTGRRITVTRYRIGEPTTSFHDRKEYIVYHSHPSSPGYQGDEDERYFSDDGHRDPKRRPGVDRYHEREQRSHQGVPKPSQPKKPKPTHTDDRSSKSKSYSNHKYATHHYASQSKPESGSSRRQEKSHSSRSENRRGENTRSNKTSLSHEDREQRYHQEVPRANAKEQLPDHYATLNLGHLATDQEIKSAAKSRRVEVHPDRLKTREMSDAERANIDAAAAAVGQAADVLQNPVQKREYDHELYAAKGWKWHGK